MNTNTAPNLSSIQQCNSRIASVIIATVLTLPSMVGAAETAASPPADNSAANSPSARMLAKAQEFRQQAQTETEAAFVSYVGNTDKSKKLFGFLGKTLCPTTDPAKGWKYFFETSIWSLNFPTPASAVAVFYHSWSDVALVTVWTRSGTATTLADADLLMGDALRNIAKPPYEIEPHWLRGPFPAYLAAGISSAQTLRSSEKVFSSSNKSLKDGWRSAVQLGDAGLMDANHLGVGAMFERSLAGLKRFEDDEAMAPVRDQTRGTLEQLRTKHLDVVYKTATETNPQVRSILEKYADKWGTAQVITCVTKRDDQKKDHTFVVLSIPKQPEMLMSLWFQEGANKSLPVSLRRIDLLDQNQSYKYLDSIAKMNQAPERGNLTSGIIEWSNFVGHLTSIDEKSMQRIMLATSAGGPVGSLLGGCCDELLGRTVWDNPDDRATTATGKTPAIATNKTPTTEPNKRPAGDGLVSGATNSGVPVGPQTSNPPGINRGTPPSVAQGVPPGLHQPANPTGWRSIPGSSSTPSGSTGVYPTKPPTTQPPPYNPNTSVKPPTWHPPATIGPSGNSTPPCNTSGSCPPAR